MEASPGEPPCTLSRPSSFAAPSAKSRRSPSRQQGAPTHRSLYRLPTYLMTLHRIVQPGPVLIFTCLSVDLLKALPPRRCNEFLSGHGTSRCQASCISDASKWQGPNLQLAAPCALLGVARLFVLVAALVAITLVFILPSLVVFFTVMLLS